MSEDLRRTSRETSVIITYTHVTAEELAKLHSLIDTCGIKTFDRSHFHYVAKAEVLSATYRGSAGYTVEIKIPVSTREYPVENWEANAGRLVLNGSSVLQRIHDILDIFPENS